MATGKSDQKSPPADSAPGSATPSAAAPFGSGAQPGRKDLFRQKAVDNLDAKSALEPLLRVTSARLWLALVACIVVVGAAVLWSVAGAAPATVNGIGAVLPASGLVSVTSSEMGTVISAPAAGTKVEAGQPLCSLKTASGGVAEVTAPVAGTIDQVFVSSGSFVPTTSAVAEMVPSGPPLRGLIFVSASQGKLIRPGMQVNLSPTTAPSADYGSIRGAVLSVSSFPLGTHRISLLVGSRPSLASSIEALGPSFEVVVALDRDPSASSGYAWTSGRGPDFEIPAGTLLTATITTSVQRPAQAAF